MIRRSKGEWVPVYVAVGLILLSAGFGVHTVIQQMGRAPGVYVKKSRRETVPEVDDPDQQLELAERFMNKSFFRKIAHIQDYDLPHNNMPDPIRDDIYAKYAYILLSIYISLSVVDYWYGCWYDLICLQIVWK